MGLERTMVSSKLDDENLEFLEQWEKQQKPYSVSQSSLVNLCVRIVRKLHRRGDLSLEPKDLQVLLSTDGTASTSGTASNWTQAEAERALVRVPKGAKR